MTKAVGVFRQDILDIAAFITHRATRGDPESVTRHAAPLLEWVEQGSDKADTYLRYRALSQQKWNSGATPTGQAEITNDPEEFLRRAKILYAFATAGGDSQ